MKPESFAVYPNQRDKKSDMHMISLGSKVPLPQWISRPKGFPHYVLMFFHNNAVIKNAQGSCPLPAGSLYIHSPEREHRYGPEDAGRVTLHSWISCSGGGIERLMKECLVSCDSPILIGEERPFSYALEGLRHELLQENAPDFKIVHNLLEIFFLEIKRRRDSPQHYQDHRVCNRLKACHVFIEENFRTPLHLDSLAKRAGLSAAHFCFSYRNAFQITPIQHLTRLRIREACFLLGDVNLSVADIAEKVGYTDAFYFSRLFKKRLRLSPLAYRKLLNKGGNRASFFETDT